jgi:hypothetical protein
MPFYTQNVASQGAHPNSSPFIISTFGLAVKSIKEFEGASSNIWTMFFLLDFFIKFFD